MNGHNLATIINAFSGLHVLVIGEAMLDYYSRGPSGRLCREAPVPIVDVVDQTVAAGGAANAAVNVRALGAQVTYLSVIGDDEAGRVLRHSLNGHDVRTSLLLADRSRQTLSKHRVIAGNQLLVRFDHGTTSSIDGAVETKLMRQLQEGFRRADVVIVSDYGYGILTRRLIDRLAQLQARWPRLLVLDAKRPELYQHAGVTAVKPNYGEAVRLLKLDAEEESAARVAQVAACEEQMLARTGAQIVAVTMDQEGALVFEKGRPPYRTYARPHPDSRAAGAGDTFISALALALAAGAHTPAAADIASAAASIVVAKDGTTVCSAAELNGYLLGDEKVVDAHTLAGQVAFYRRQEKRIVFTNGCFDILHRGHITYLSQAKALGDILIVGLNSDDSVRRLKGPARPINTLEDRAQLLAAMSCTDHVVPFAEDTPAALIRIVRPDIFVKGGDYTPETLPEAPLVHKLGGKVHILPYMDDVSTTTIIERIRERERLNGNGRARTGTISLPGALGR